MRRRAEQGRIVGAPRENFSGATADRTYTTFRRATLADRIFR